MIGNQWRLIWRSLFPILGIGLIGICLIFTNISSISEGNALAANTPLANQISDRLEIIKTKMAKLRFCYNESCFYRNITSKITAPSDLNPHYNAIISAAIERPSSSPDLADYHFIYVNDRWRLIRGEEFTDVADYAFIGDRYEIYSVHSSHILRGNLNKAKEDGSIKAGYLSLYYTVLEQGIERSDL